MSDFFETVFVAVAGLVCIIVVLVGIFWTIYGICSIASEETIKTKIKPECMIEVKKK